MQPQIQYCSPTHQNTSYYFTLEQRGGGGGDGGKSEQSETEGSGARGAGGEMAPAGASICPTLYLIIAVLIDTEAAEIAGVLPTEQSWSHIRPEHTLSSV